MRDTVRTDIVEHVFVFITGGPFDVAAGVTRHQNIACAQVCACRIAIEVASITSACLHERIYRGSIGGIMASVQESPRCSTEAAHALVSRNFNLHHLTVGVAMIERGSIRVSGFLW